jgi:GT2 family glycosyltransferase
MHRISVLMTSFNRREMTLRSLGSVFGQAGLDGVQLTVFLVEDGCTDGTGEAVRAAYPQVRLLHGDGSLYWNGGMRVAFAAALRDGFDGYLLLNDDTRLDDDALSRLVACSERQLVAGGPAIVVGSTRSPLNGRLSYGGILRKRRGFSVVFEKVEPRADEAIACDTMNGNIVLIPAAVAAVVGNLEARFHHHFGDLDYGLRARRAGFAVMVAPGYLGECATNPARGTWRDAGAPLAKRWKHLMSPKGQPVAEWLLFTRRHFGWRWMHYAWSPYVKTVVSGLRAGGRD